MIYYKNKPKYTFQEKIFKNLLKKRVYGEKWVKTTFLVLVIVIVIVLVQIFKHYNNCCCSGEQKLEIKSQVFQFYLKIIYSANKPLKLIFAL